MALAVAKNSRRGGGTDGVAGVVDGDGFGICQEHEGKEAAFTKWRDGVTAVTKDFTYTEYAKDEHMLYDLKKDPEENVNVAADPDYANTLKRMKKLLHRK